MEFLAEHGEVAVTGEVDEAHAPAALADPDAIVLNQRPTKSSIIAEQSRLFRDVARFGR